MKEKWIPALFALFFSFVCIQRLLETFAKRPVVKGNRLMRWSFPMMTAIHSGVFVGSAVEYFLVKRPINYTLSAIGLVLYIFSLVLRNVAIRTLGRYFSLHIEIRQKHELIQEGVYHYVRHPIYSAVVLELISVPLVANAYVTLAVALLVYMPMLAWRLRREEEAMVEKFGGQYQQYQERTGALWPRWSAWHRS
jgi:isoprenylcysteine carboxyl methyltransferase (ICMT) family protein YpbQ